MLITDRVEVVSESVGWLVGWLSPQLNCRCYHVPVPSLPLLLFECGPLALAGSGIVTVEVVYGSRTPDKLAHRFMF